MEKPARTPEQIRAMVQVRLNALPLLGRPGQAGHARLPVAGMPVAHQRDVLGRNWDIAKVEDGAGRMAEFRAIVDELRRAYDLTPPNHL